jgi:Fe2+ transport system protein FeoA
VALFQPITTSDRTSTPACTLSQVRAGTPVRIKRLLAAPELCRRLRELGLYEERQVKLLLRQGNVVCQVCNVRLGLSAVLADRIEVEPLPEPEPAPSNQA